LSWDFIFYYESTIALEGRPVRFCFVSHMKYARRRINTLRRLSMTILSNQEQIVKAQQHVLLTC